jgi:hypothetical protein
MVLLFTSFECQRREALLGGRLLKEATSSGSVTPKTFNVFQVASEQVIIAHFRHTGKLGGCFKTRLWSAIC